MSYDYLDHNQHDCCPYFLLILAWIRLQACACLQNALGPFINAHFVEVTKSPRIFKNVFDLISDNAKGARRIVQKLSNMRADMRQC